MRKIMGTLTRMTRVMSQDPIDLRDRRALQNIPGWRTYLAEALGWLVTGLVTNQAEGMLDLDDIYHPRELQQKKWPCMWVTVLGTP